MTLYSINNLKDLKQLRALAEKQDELSRQRVLERVQKQTFDENALNVFKPIIKSTQEVVKAIQDIEPPQITPLPAIEQEYENSHNFPSMMTPLEIEQESESDERAGSPAVDKELSDVFAAIVQQGYQPGLDVVPAGPNEYVINQTLVRLKDNVIYGRDFQIPSSPNILNALYDRNINPSTFSYEDQHNLHNLLSKVNYKVLKGKPSTRLTWYRNFTSNQNIRFLSSDPNELVERLKVLVQERQAGNDNVLNEGTAILDFLRENYTMTDEEYKNAYDKLK